MHRYNYETKQNWKKKLSYSGGLENCYFLQGYQRRLCLECDNLCLGTGAGFYLLEIWIDKIKTEQRKNNA